MKYQLEGSRRVALARYRVPRHEVGKGDCATSTVRIIDPKTGTTIDEIPMGMKPQPFRDRVLIERW
jgi:hypothetical protein